MYIYMFIVMSCNTVLNKNIFNENNHLPIHMHCAHALGTEWMRATRGLLAQSAGGRDGRTEGKEGAAA